MVADGVEMLNILLLYLCQRGDGSSDLKEAVDELGGGLEARLWGEILRNVPGHFLVQPLGLRRHSAHVAGADGVGFFEEADAWDLGPLAFEWEKDWGLCGGR